MEPNRRNPLHDEDVQRIADAVAAKTNHVFYIEAEDHYNAHKRLDALLKVYEDAQNLFWKGFIGLVIVGSILLAGVGIARGTR